jgi:hypothetical protein
VRYDVAALGRDEGLIASNGWVHDAVVGRLGALFSKK